ncbi:MAG: PilZ domain-containing protein [Planctomycetes bacterium]|nr:PilZ domain-containing protein [Planctomycetota bacterium]
MMFTGEEKRRAARIRFRVSDNLQICYKFLSHLEGFQCDEIFEAPILNVSTGGILFVGSLPGRDWLPQLGQGLVMIGANLMVPEKKPVKGLCSLRWTRPSPVQLGPRYGSGEKYELGVQFEQLDNSNKQALEKFLIGHQIRTRRFRVRDEMDRRFN